MLGTRIRGSSRRSSSEAAVGFRLRREEDIRLDVVDSSGTVVRQALGEGIFGQAFHKFAWDGRDDAGRVVPDGVYTGTAPR